METVAPGFASSVLHRQVIGPREMEQEYGLVGGNIFHGELTLGQMFHARPAAGYADLRTPVRGLYQAGSSTHGGGGVTGIPGRNVVHQVLADRGPRGGAAQATNLSMTTCPAAALGRSSTEPPAQPARDQRRRSWPRRAPAARPAAGGRGVVRSPRPRPTRRSRCRSRAQRDRPAADRAACLQAGVFEHILEL